MRRWLIIGVCLFATSVWAQEKIIGPWLWMIAPTEGPGGAAAIDKDSLDKASGGKVTEEMIAKNGAKPGDSVGEKKWTLGEIAPVGGNNINDVVVKIGIGVGDVNDHSAYALITLVSAEEQKNKIMRVGSDDAIKVWLNGEVVHRNAIDRGASNFQDEFKVNLKKGENLLLVKVSERGGGWSMFVGIQAEFQAAGKNYKPTPEPPKKIEGPWLWMMAPAGPPGGAAATDEDSLAKTTKGKVTEEMIAKKGAKEGDAVDKLKWTPGKIAPTGGNNVNDVMNAIKLGVGDINDHSAYALINVVSPEAKNNVTMMVGSDDSIKVWLNGEVVHRNAVDRGADGFQDEFKVNLKKGDNLLLVKVSERGGGWSMFVGIQAEGLTYNLNTSRDAKAVDPRGKLPAKWGEFKGQP